MKSCKENGVEKKKTYNCVCGGVGVGEGIDLDLDLLESRLTKTNIVLRFWENPNLFCYYEVFVPILHL